jgi:hypothetical protein
MRTSIAVSILIAAGAADAAVIPDFQQPSLEAIADRMHTRAVQVVASRGDAKVSMATGVLAGDGIVLTDLRAVVAEAPGGAAEAASAIAVVTAEGVFAARLVGAALDADVAVLELPEAARGLAGPLLAEGPIESGAHLLAIRASIQGTSLFFDVVGFSIERALGVSEGPHATPELPNTFAGAPVFDAQGALAGLLVNPNEQTGVLVPAARLREILARARHLTPRVDDHI